MVSTFCACAFDFSVFFFLQSRTRSLLIFACLFSFHREFSRSSVVVAAVLPNVVPSRRFVGRSRSSCAWGEPGDFKSCARRDGVQVETRPDDDTAATTSGRRAMRSSTVAAAGQWARVATVVLAAVLCGPRAG